MMEMLVEQVADRTPAPQLDIVRRYIGINNKSPIIKNMLEKKDLGLFLVIIFSTIFLLGFVLISCTSFESLAKPTPTFPYPLIGTVDHRFTPTSTSPPPTFTARPVITFAPTSTYAVLGGDTISMSPTPDSKVTVTVTSTYLPYSLAPPLENMLLTRDDVKGYYDRTTASLRYIEEFFDDQETNIVDVSSEVSDGCLYECTKQVWATTSVAYSEEYYPDFVYYRKAVIFMARSRNEITAGNLAENLYEEFAPFEYDLEPNDYQGLNPPAGKTQIGYTNIESHDGLIVVLTTSRGPIALMVVNYVPPFSDDGMTEVDFAIHFANIQFDKLLRSAVIP